MGDLISREALIEDIKSSNDSIVTKVDIIRMVNEQPTVEARPVVHGEFKYMGGIIAPRYVCSICGGETSYPNAFCSYCGADMREKVQE